MKFDLNADYMRAASLGLEIATAVFVAGGVGYWLDRQWQTGPWGMVVGVVLGSIAGFWNAYKFAVSENK